MKQKWGELLLIFITAIWGTTFLAIQDVLPAWPPFILMAGRFGLAAVVILPFALSQAFERRALRCGMLLGLYAFGGFSLQTESLRYTTASHAAFCTALVTIFVPLLGRLFWQIPWRSSTLYAVVLTCVGIALLVGDQMTFDVMWGDALAVGGAVLFALQVILLTQYSRVAPIPQLVAIEVSTVAALSYATSQAMREAPPALSTSGLLTVGYLGIVATAFCLLAQVFGQARTSATRAGFIYALEPVFAASFGWALRGQRLNALECLGGMFLICAAVAADAPMPRRFTRVRRGSQKIH